MNLVSLLCMLENGQCSKCPICANHMQKPQLTSVLLLWANGQEEIEETDVKRKRRELSLVVLGPPWLVRAWPTLELTFSLGSCLGAVEKSVIPEPKKVTQKENGWVLRAFVAWVLCLSREASCLVVLCLQVWLQPDTSEAPSVLG